MSFTNSAALPYTLGGVVVAAAIGGGASGLFSTGIAAALSLSGLLWLLDAHIGTTSLSYLAIKQPVERQVLAQRLYFSRPAAWWRYLLEGMGSPMLFITVALTGLGYATIAVMIACISAGGIYSAAILLKDWKQAGSATGLSGG